MRDWGEHRSCSATRSLSRRCRVPGEPDDSKIAAQRSLCEPGSPSALDREFAQNDSYARHRPIRSRALRSGSRNPECSSPADADGEIYSLQSFGSANGPKVRPQDRLLSFATNERDSRRIILLASAVSRKADQPPLTFHLRRRLRRDKQSPPRKRGEASRISSVASSVAEARRALLSVLSVPLSMKVFAACANFRPLCFVPQSAGLLECALPARRVRASSRRFWGRRPLIEKRCEDASHSQRTSCKIPWTHSDLSISV